MKPASRQNAVKAIRFGTLAFGVALLLRSDTPFDGLLDALAEPEPEPRLSRVLPGLPEPMAVKPARAESASLPRPVPTLSATLLGPRAEIARASGPRQIKARSRAGSALSGTLAGTIAPLGRTQREALLAPVPPAPTAAMDFPIGLTAQSTNLAGASLAEPEPPALLAAAEAPAPAVVSLDPVPQPTLMQLAPAPAEPVEVVTTDEFPEVDEVQTLAQAAAELAPAAPVGEHEPDAIQPFATSAAATSALPEVEQPPAPMHEQPGILALQTAPSAPLLEDQTGTVAAPRQLASSASHSASTNWAQAPPAPVQLAQNTTVAVPPVPGKGAGSAPSVAKQADAKPLPTLASVFAGTSLAAKAAPTAAIAAPLTGNGGALSVGAQSPGRQDAEAELIQPSSLQQFAGGAPPDLSDDDELILELRLDDGTLADTLVGYGTRNGVYLPLGPMVRTLDLAIVVSNEGTYANGWFLDEKRTLTIDLRQQVLEVEGKPRKFPQGVFVARNGEMYVQADFLGELLPLTLKADLRDQSVTITTREPFPFEARLAREEARSRLGNQQNATLAEVFKRERTDWRLVDFPLMDIETRAVSDSTLGTRAEGDLRLSTDLAYMNAQTYFSGSTRDGLTAARIELGRQDPDGNLLGPLSATEFQIGDVSTPTLPIGLRGTAGRGAFVTNASLYRASVFDKVDLRGELPDGYEVELYRNNVLIGSTRTPVNGRYEFLQVPVDFGLNVMRLVFYGPQGQRREEVRQIAVGDGRLAKGEFEYGIGLAQKDRNLLDVHGPFFSPNRDYGAWRLTGQLAYGLTNDLTGVLSAARFDSDLGDRWQISSGVRTGIGGVSSRLDTAFQDGGGKAIQLGLGTRMFGSALTLSHGEYFGQFIDEVRAFDSAPLRRATELNLSGGLDLSLGKAASVLPYSLRMRRIEFADGRTQNDAALRGTVRLGTLMVSKSFEYQHNTLPGVPSSRLLTGTFDLARLSGSRLDVRGGVGYRILPSLKVQSATIQADYAIDARTLVNATAGRSFDNAETFLGLSATRRFDRFTLGFDSNYSLRSNSYSVALRLGFSLGRHPITRKVFIDDPGLAGAGAVAIRAFHDVDGDDRFGPADQPLEGVTFFSGGQSKVTDANGVTLIGELPSGSRASLQVDQDTIQDIALAPRARGFEVVPRPGRIHVKDFAIVDVSEVAGTTLFDQSGTRQAVSGLRLELVDAAGKVVAKARSESDGYFFFEQVVPGSYTIRIEADQAKRLGVTVKVGASLEVKAGQVAPMFELVVEDAKVNEPVTAG